MASDKLYANPRKLVNELKEGAVFNGVLWVANKQLRKTYKGKPYLDLELSDKTGSINGKIWDDALQRDGLFAKGDFVLINAKVESYDNRRQLIISSISRVDESQIDRSDFVPHTKQDIELLLVRVKEICETIQNSYLSKLVQAFLQDRSFTDLFKQSPAAVTHHQSYLGGLLEHTVQVLNSAQAILSIYPNLDKDLLLAGAFLHDIGKVHEYTIHLKPEHTDEGRLVGHTVLGVLMLEEKVSLIKDFPTDLLMKLRHLIISHHGKYEFGAPVLPMTPEALTLHYLDNLDADLAKYQQDIANIPDEQTHWTEWSKSMSRRFYRSAPSPLRSEEAGGDKPRPDEAGKIATPSDVHRKARNDR